MPNTELVLSWLMPRWRGWVAAFDHCQPWQDPTGSGHTGPIIATPGRLRCSCWSLPSRAGPNRVRPHRADHATHGRLCYSRRSLPSMAGPNRVRPHRADHGILRSSLTGILRSSLTGILRSSLTIVVVVLVVVDVIVVVVVVVVVAVVVVVVDVVVVVVDVLVVVVVAVDLVVEAAFRLQFPNPPFIWSKHICQYKSLHFQFSPNSSSTLIFLIRTMIQFQIILRPSAWSFQIILNSFIPQFLFKSFINFLRLILWNRISPYQGNILQVIILSLSFEVSQTIQNHFSSSQARVTSQKSLTFVAFPTSHNTFPFIWSFQTIQNHFSSSQARVTSPKSLTFVAFPTHTVFNLNLIHSIFTSWNNDVQSLASWVRLTLVQQIPNIAWISFDLQEHKIHNNASPCYGTSKIQIVFLRVASGSEIRFLWKQETARIPMLSKYPTFQNIEMWNIFTILLQITIISTHF